MIGSTAQTAQSTFNGSTVVAKMIKRLNSQTTKGSVIQEKCQTAETVQRHKMDEVSELVQSPHIDKIHQEAKFAQISLVLKQAKRVKKKPLKKLAKLTFLLVNYALFSCAASNKFFACWG